LGLLSNLLRFGHERADADAAPLTIRRAAEPELEAAVRLILSPPGATIEAKAVEDFISLSRDRGIELDALHVAARGEKLVSAMLPVISPGRTMLILCPPGNQAKAIEAATAQLIDPVCRYAAAKAVYLAQTLVDPQDQVLEKIFTGDGFTRMAELHYLQVQPPAEASFPPLSADLSWLGYSDQTHPLFGQAILESYNNSLDCPALNGQRDIEDIIAGHKASGIFDPALWFLLRHGEKSLGVLLLSESLRSDAVELVYLGLTPAARGQKLGELLMRQALAIVADRKQARLCLAVDARNTPALKLYYRHGMHRVATKHAMIRDLRPPSIENQVR
jgi:mycothiol synthase